MWLFIGFVGCCGYDKPEVKVYYAFPFSSMSGNVYFFPIIYEISNCTDNRWKIKFMAY